MDVCKNGGGTICLWDGETRIASMSHEDGEPEAEQRAQTIAHAVNCHTDLLAACERMMTFERWKNMLGDENRAASYLDAMDKLRAAIHKAKHHQVPAKVNS